MKIKHLRSIAEKNYPSGTTVKCLRTSEYCVVEGDYTLTVNGEIKAKSDSSKEVILKDTTDKWAEIKDRPNIEEAEYRFPPGTIAKNSFCDTTFRVTDDLSYNGLQIIVRSDNGTSYTLWDSGVGWAHKVDLTYKKGDNVRLKSGPYRGLLGKIIEVSVSNVYTVEYCSYDSKAGLLKAEWRTTINQIELDVVKYKVGDKVKIVRKFKIKYGIYWAAYMDSSLGQVTTITKIKENTYITDLNMYSYPGECFELVSAFDIGDRVRISKSFGTSSYIFWAEEMDATINKIGIVKSIEEGGKVYRVYIPEYESYWNYPIEALEVLENALKLIGCEKVFIVDPSRVEILEMKSPEEKQIPIYIKPVKIIYKPKPVILTIQNG